MTSTTTENLNQKDIELAFFVQREIERLGLNRETVQREELTEQYLTEEPGEGFFTGGFD